MLTTIEIPGIYIQPDKGLFTVFDNIVAKKIKETNSEWSIELSNPTAMDAVVTILEENANNTHHILGENALYGAKKMAIKSGSSVILHYKK
jgi:hypothetical protein